MGSSWAGLQGTFGGQWRRAQGQERFGFRVRQARARPSNTTIRGLLSDDRSTEAVLVFLGPTLVREVKEGVICT